MLRLDLMTPVNIYLRARALSIPQQHDSNHLKMGIPAGGAMEATYVVDKFKWQEMLVAIKIIKN